MQQQETRRNYIGIVSDTTEEDRAADTAARSQPRVMSDLVGRLATVLKRRAKPGSGRPPSA